MMQRLLQVSLLMGALITTAHAETKMVIPAPPTIAAKAYVLMDANSGQVIAGLKEHERFAPASLTKLLTSYIVEERLEEGKIKEQDLVTISEKAWRTEGSRTFAELNSQVSVIDLLRGVIIQSGNDASVALAEYVSGSDTAFADEMNHYAEKIGMKNSHFMNPEGLPDPNHYSTAYDIAVLSKAIIDDHPDYYKIYSEKEFFYNGIKQGNRNTLLYKDATVDGLKTGHTEEAGYCLAASALRNGMRLISVVLGTDGFTAREEASAALLDYGFRYYKTVKVYDAKQPLQSVRLWKGKSPQISLGVADKLYVTLPKDQPDSIKTVLTLNADVVAPVPLGEVVGKIDVILNDKPFASVPLITLEAGEPGGFFSRMWDAIALFFHHLMS